VATVWPFWVQKELNRHRHADSAEDERGERIRGGGVRRAGRRERPAFSAIRARARTTRRTTFAAARRAPLRIASRRRKRTRLIGSWDGPRNDHGLRIWFPFGRGANAGVTNSPPFGGPGGSLGIFWWSHRDLNFDFTSELLSQFDDETELATRVVAPYSDIISTDLHRAKKGGAKILMCTAARTSLSVAPVGALLPRGGRALRRLQETADLVPLLPRAGRRALRRRRGSSRRRCSTPW